MGVQMCFFFSQVLCVVEHNGLERSTWWGSLNPFHIPVKVFSH